MARITVAVIVGLFSTSGCTSDTTPLAPIAPVSIASVAVPAITTIVEVGDVVSLNAIVVASNGVHVLDRTVTWTSDDINVASVTSTGPLTASLRGVGPGQVTIRATLEGKTGSLGITTLAVIDEPNAHSGRLVFVQRSDRQIYRINPDGTALTRLTNLGNNESPVFSPDGRRIAFTRSGNIHLMDADGTNTRQRTVGANFRQVAWSPDGRTLAASDGNIYEADLWLMSADEDGSDPILLASQAALPAWSPDGKKIAFVRISGDDGYHRIDMMNADGTGVTSLTQIDPGAITGLAWSPDGNRIAFSKCLTGSCDLHAIDAAGGTARRITSAGNVFWAAWSPDGAWIALTLGFDVVAYVRAEGGTPRIVASGGYHPSWHPVVEP